jgi:hypothetical protein
MQTVTAQHGGLLTMPGSFVLGHHPGSVLGSERATERTGRRISNYRVRAGRRMIIFVRRDWIGGVHEIVNVVAATDRRCSFTPAAASELINLNGAVVAARPNRP